jgi:hypothetical protein
MCPPTVGAIGRGLSCTSATHNWVGNERWPRGRPRPWEAQAWEADTLPAELLPLGRAAVVIADRARGAERGDVEAPRGSRHSAQEADAQVIWRWQGCSQALPWLQRPEKATSLRAHDKARYRGCPAGPAGPDAGGAVGDGTGTKKPRVSADSADAQHRQRVSLWPSAGQERRCHEAEDTDDDRGERSPDLDTRGLERERPCVIVHRVHGGAFGMRTALDTPRLLDSI